MGVRNPNREVQEALAKLDRDGDFPCPIRIASSGDLSLTDVDIEPFIDSLQLDDRLLSQLSLHLASSGGSRVHNAETYSIKSIREGIFRIVFC